MSRRVAFGHRGLQAPEPLMSSFKLIPPMKILRIVNVSSWLLAETLNSLKGSIANCSKCEFYLNQIFELATQCAGQFLVDCKHFLSHKSIASLCTLERFEPNEESTVERWIHCEKAL